MNDRCIFNPSSRLRPTVIVSTCMTVSEVLRKVLCKRLAEAPCLSYQGKQGDLPLWKKNKTNILSLPECSLRRSRNPFLHWRWRLFLWTTAKVRLFIPVLFSLCSFWWQMILNSPVSPAEQRFGSRFDPLTPSVPPTKLHRLTCSMSNWVEGGSASPPETITEDWNNSERVNNG